jgi:hypothetical protein
MEKTKGCRTDERAIGWNVRNKSGIGISARVFLRTVERLDGDARYKGGALNRLFLAISWGVFALAMSYYLEKEMFVRGASGNWMLWVIFPILEEFLKWTGYKQVKSFSLLIPVTFCVGELVIKIFEWNQSATQLVSQEAVAILVILSTSQLFLLKHVAFWILPYLLKFRWYAFPLAVLAHSVWNMSIAITELQWLMTLFILPLAFVLVKWGKEIDQ